MVRNLFIQTPEVQSIIEIIVRDQESNLFQKKKRLTIALLLGIDFSQSKFDLDEFWMGVNIELEHGKISSQTNVTGDDPIITGKIALAHLNEFPDYYKRLKVLEEEAKAYWNK